MIGTITPLVQGVAARRARLTVPIIYGAFQLSSTAGGVLVAVVVRAMRGVTPALATKLSETAPLALSAAALYVLAAKMTGRMPLPMRNQQVPIEWRSRFSPVRALLLYGLVLGAGIFTRINALAFYLGPVAAIIAPTTLLGLAPWAVFAAGRAAVVVTVSHVGAPRFRDQRETVVGWGFHHRPELEGLQWILMSAVSVAGPLAMILGRRAGA